MPGRGSSGHGADASAAGSSGRAIRARRGPGGRGGTPSQGIALPPAGWTSRSRGVPSPVPQAARSSNDAGSASLVRVGRSPPRRRAARRRLEEGARPRLVGADLALELDGRARGSSRPSSRRSGRVRVAPSTGWGRARDLAAQPGPRRRSSRSRRDPASARLELRRRLGPVERQSAPGRRSDRCRARVHPDQRDARLAVAGQDRRRDRRRAAVARQQRRMEVQRAVRRRRAARPGRSGRSRRGPGAPGRAPGPRDGLGRAEPSGVRIGRDAERAAAARPGRRRSAATGRPRAAARDDADELDVGVLGQAPEARDPNAPLPRKTVRTREPRRAVVTPGRSSPRGPPRRPRSPCPTAMSSSIESR